MEEYLSARAAPAAAMKKIIFSMVKDSQTKIAGFFN